MIFGTQNPLLTRFDPAATELVPGGIEAAGRETGGEQP